MPRVKKETRPPARRVGGVIDGYEPYALQKLSGDGTPIAYIAQDEETAARLKTGLSLLGLSSEIFPAWETVPYDRVSPSLETMGKRIALLRNQTAQILIIPAKTLLQKIPEQTVYRKTLRTNDSIAQEELSKIFLENGYERTFEVLKPGDFAIRGGLLDVFIPALENPLRIDFFGDVIDRIKTFDAGTQLSIDTFKDAFAIVPISEVILSRESIENFRTGYRKLGGNVADNIYRDISEGRKVQGMEQYLPLFHKKGELKAPLDFFKERKMIVHESAFLKLEETENKIKSFEEARNGTEYTPVPYDMFYESAETVAEELRKEITLTPFDTGVNGFKTKPFAFSNPDRFLELRDIIKTENVKIAAVSVGSKERLAEIMEERYGTHISKNIFVADDAFRQGFRSPEFTLVTEEDIFGERFVKKTRRKKKEILSDLTTIAVGDLLVHKLHGIGRYEGLETLTLRGDEHDCLKLSYAEDDRLFVPVENMDLLSRYGTEGASASLDKLGGTAWQARVARLKKRLLERTKELMELEAKRRTKEAPVFLPPEGYSEFCAGFPYQETEDQEEAIDDVLRDLSEGKPTDRLVCGDVGFGKTEVALRAAYTVAKNGRAVAMLVPTTLLARQHYATFKERFKNTGIEIGQLSRFTKPKEKQDVKLGLKLGVLNIVIGTHALLAKDIDFKNLALLIIDEEQRFGVAFKEKLKKIKENVHVLTLTATPIPRTLQMSLSGIRKLSLMMTPPVSRLAVQTSVAPFDEVIIKEAIGKELLRNGQAFYVVPRISRIAAKSEILKELLPDLRIQIVHGRMAPARIEKIMSDFLAQKFDVLLSTTIVESGLDMPRVNTIVIDEADRYGLAQLYQLRGRVGRGNLKGYCYLTYRNDKPLTEQAQKRLLVMESLETLGVGFKLAEYDLDIRGAGNLLGDEQSGHIKEVGIELYQKMLEDAVKELMQNTVEARAFTPQLNLGIPVLIPEEYIGDLGLRLGMYRRIADIRREEDLNALKVELIDRFGKLPEETENLLSLVELKNLCLKTGVEKLDGGEKGLILSFFNNRFTGAEKLIDFMRGQAGTVRVRPDQKLVLFRYLKTKRDKFEAAKFILSKLAGMIE